jgi:O-antigen/teichoic acid export membrane protein
MSAKRSASAQDDTLRHFVEAGQKHILIGTCLSITAVLSILSVLTPLSATNVVLIAGLVGVGVFGAASANFYGGVLVGLNKQCAGLLPDTLLKPVVFLGLVVFVAGIGNSFSPVGILACFVLGALASAAVVYLQLSAEQFMSQARDPEKSLIEWCKTTYPWIVTTLVWDFFIELHIVLSGWMAAPAEVAVLHVAFRLRMIAGYGMRALYALFLPDIVNAHTRGEDTQVRAKLDNANRLAFAYSVMVMIFFAVAGGALMGILGNDFEAGWSLLLIVSTTMVTRALFGPAPALLAMSGHQIHSALVMLGCLIFSLINTIMLYPTIGIAAFGVSYAIANFLGSVILWQYSKKLTRVDCSLFAWVQAGKSSA